MSTTDFLTALGLMVAAMGLILIIYQTGLLIRQSRIIEKQDGIFARRPKLDISNATREVSSSIACLEFFVNNSGLRGVEKFYWFLWLPPGMADEVPTAVSGVKSQGKNVAVRADQVDGQEYRLYNGLLEVPLYHNLPVNFVDVFVSLGQGRGPYHLYWRIVTEFGPSPERLPGFIVVRP